MKMTYECSHHDGAWEELDLARGFAFVVQIDDEGIEGHALGERFPGVVQWLDGEGLNRIVFADGEDAVHLMQHVVNDLILTESDNGHGDVEHEDVVSHPAGEVTELGPTDDQLDAWLVEWFGEAKPGAGHKFNLVFARALIEFGRSFT